MIWFAINNIERKSGQGQSADVDVDLSSQVNTSLCSEILYYTTSGIKESVCAVTAELISVLISGEVEAHKKQECGDGMNFHKPDIDLKDNDLMIKIRIDPATAHRIYDQIHKDSDLLCSQGILHYILLMGIQSLEYFVDTSQLPRARRDLLFTQPATSVAGPSLYHFGIIDFLQQWYVRRMAVKTLADMCLVIIDEIMLEKRWNVSTRRSSSVKTLK
ncbi:hypothetical protein PsorP6_011943 [Peronosclerospora sorghi]|uniref:Uncharacterized protein n=1 Tax=Peronosclerospora sorghi TaxID=230839 RepID=A0ACC0WKC1_9STRA|nr:hypothetical protein PsorP6_011943 [Peronosclerospora sorghi]